jgi:hypothetical protein
MSFEIDPPDEPCPDCGSTHHRQCDIKPKFDWHFKYTEMAPLPPPIKDWPKFRRTSISENDCCACLKFGPPPLGFVQCPCNCHKHIQEVTMKKITTIELYQQIQATMDALDKKETTIPIAIATFQLLQAQASAANLSLAVPSAAELSERFKQKTIALSEEVFESSEEYEESYESSAC